MEIPDFNRNRQESSDDVSRKGSQHHGSFYQSNDSQVNEYKKKLLHTVIGISLVILFIIVERIFYESSPQCPRRIRFDFRVHSMKFYLALEQIFQQKQINTNKNQCQIFY